MKKLIRAVIKILNGSRDRAPADDTEPYFDDAAEVLFLIGRAGG